MTYEDMEREEEGARGKAVIMCLGWHGKYQHLKFHKSENCKTRGKGLVSTSKTFNAQYVSLLRKTRKIAELVTDMYRLSRSILRTHGVSKGLQTRLEHEAFQHGRSWDDHDG